MARRLDPERVAAGEGRPGVAELIDLIHQVNPTDRGLGAVEQARRYALRARLQSRLLREWADHLKIEGAGEDLLTVRHRGHGRDAAHVVRSALDPDARAVVDRILAFGHEAPSASARSGTAPRATGTSGDPLQAGRAALDEYDYDAARAHFTAALAGTRSEAAAHALLELLVDVLADDDAAMALDVPSAALSPRVARLVGLAAARVGDARAEALLSRCDASREAAIRLVLAEAALRAEDPATLARHLHALRELDPANGAVSRLAEAHARLAAAPLAPLEAALARAVADGVPDALRAACDALLTVAPSHGGARAALARLEASRRRAQADEHLVLADRHRAEGRCDLEVDALERADALVSGSAPGLADARRRLAARREEDATIAAGAALRDGDLRPYVALPAGRRAELRVSHGDDRLLVLEGLLDLRDPLRALQRVEAAREHQRAGRPDRALALLAEQDLEGHPSLRPLVRELRADLVARQAEEAAAATRAALDAMTDGRHDEGLRLAERVRKERLSPGDREALERACADATARVAELRDVEEFDRSMCAVELTHARIVAERRRADPVWERRYRAADDHIRRSFAPALVDPEHVPLRWGQTPSVQPTADACLEADGAHAWLTESVGSWCYLPRIELATQRVVSCLRLRTSVAFGRPRTAVHGERLFLASQGARLLALDRRPDGDVDRILWCTASLSSYLPECHLVDPGRDPDFVPLLVDGHGEAERWTVWVGDDRRALIKFDVVSACILHVRGLGPRLLLAENDGAVTLYDPRTRKSAGRVGWALRVDSAAPSPRGAGILACGAFPGGDKADLEIAILDPASQLPRKRVGLGGHHGVRLIASSSATGLAYVLCDALYEHPFLCALDADLRVVWRVDVPGAAHLLVDVEDRHAALVRLTRTGLRVDRLGSEPPPPVDAPVPPTFGFALPWGEHVATDRPLAKPQSPVVDQIRAAIAAADRGTSPEDRFATLDLPEVWECGEVQSMSRLAEAARDAADLPREARIHAMAAWLDAYVRWQLQGFAAHLELPGAPAPRSRAELDALGDSARRWLDQAAADDGWERYTPEQPKWTSSRDWTA